MSADVVGGTLRVSHDAAQLSAAAIAGAVNATGMRAWLDHDTASHMPSVRRRREFFLVASGLAAAGIALDWFGAPMSDRRAFRRPWQRAAGWRARWSAARLVALDINTLMLIALSGPSPSASGPRRPR
jgi:hypothetical protein